MVASVKVSDEPLHNDDPPLIIAGEGFTIIVFETPQEPRKYPMVTVPGSIPVTTPPVVTLAIDGLLLLQPPPDDASVNVIAEPWQTVVEPAIGAG